MKVYFYKKFNGEIFSCEAKEASMIHSKYEQVGVSDGTSFDASIATARNENKDLLELIAEYKNELSKIEDPEEKMLYKKKLRPLQSQWEKIFKKAYEDGYNAELEKAKGHHEVPPDFSRTELVGAGELTEKPWTGEITKS